jgi:hypothetical protein
VVESETAASTVSSKTSPLTESTPPAANVAQKLTAAEEEALYARGTFRKPVVEQMKSEAPRNEAGEMTCPTCFEVMPEKITKPTKKGAVERRGFDIDHFNKTWAERVSEMKQRAQETGKAPTRKEVLGEYNRLLRAQCPDCNQGHMFEGVQGVTTQETLPSTSAVKPKEPEQ